MTQSVVNAALQTIAIPILARLLAPGDYGIMAMATTVTGLASLFSDAGLGVATVQKEEINQEYVDSMFWFSAGIGLILTLVASLSSPFVVWFFDEPALLPVTIVLSFAFVINGCSMQQRALLSRHLRFFELAVVDIVATVGSFIASIAMASWGFGYWALVAVIPGASLFKTIALWFISDWRPDRPAMASGVIESLQFGANVTGFSFLNYFVRRGDDIIVGRYFGTGILGLYSRSYSLLTLPLRQIMGPMTLVMVPSLSRLQSEPDRFNRFFAQANSVAAYMVNPFVIALIVFPEDCVALILGPKWMGAVPLASMLAIGGIIQPLVSSLGWVFIATGNPNLHVRWALIVAPIFLVCFWAGAQFGVYGVAVGFTVSALFNGVGSLLFAGKFTILNLKYLLRRLTLPYALGLATFLLFLVVRVLLPDAGLYRIATAAAVVIFSYLIFFSLHYEERKFATSIIMLIKKKGP